MCCDSYRGCVRVRSVVQSVVGGRAALVHARQRLLQVLQVGLVQARHEGGIILNLKIK